MIKRVSKIEFYLTYVASFILFMSLISKLFAHVDLIPNLQFSFLEFILDIFNKNFKNLIFIAFYIYLFVSWFYLLESIAYISRVYGKHQKKVHKFLKKIAWIILFIFTTALFWLIAGKTLALTISGGAILFFILQEAVRKFKE